MTPRIEALVDANRSYPVWADFPRSTDTMAAPAEIASRVSALNNSATNLQQDTAALEWTADDDPVAFEAATRARVDAVDVAPVTAETLAEIEAYQRRVRERGRAPPPVDRR